MEDILTSWSEGLELSLKLHLNLGTGVTKTPMLIWTINVWEKENVILIYLFLYFGLNLDGLKEKYLTHLI